MHPSSRSIRLSAAIEKTHCNSISFEDEFHGFETANIRAGYPLNFCRLSPMSTSNVPELLKRSSGTFLQTLEPFERLCVGDKQLFLGFLTNAEPTTNRISSGRY
jgi:hypothetical protein